MIEFIRSLDTVVTLSFVIAAGQIGYSAWKIHMNEREKQDARLLECPVCKRYTLSMYVMTRAQKQISVCTRCGHHVEQAKVINERQ